MPVDLTLTMPAFEPLASALVVEDDEDLAYLLQYMLLRDGFIVHSATNGRDAREYIENSAPTDIVMLDLMLPYIDGFELISTIRENTRWMSTPVIVVSGKVTERDIVRALDAGANDYVTKPYNPQELVARIRRQMSLQRRPAAAPAETG